MKITRTRVLVASLSVAIIGVIGLQFVVRPMFVIWLRAHSTVRMLQSPPGGRYAIAVYRYPRLWDMPECLGFGQGYVQLYDPSTGRVLQEKVADDLAAVQNFAWGLSSVEISGFAAWEVPGWYRPPN